VQSTFIDVLDVKPAYQVIALAVPLGLPSKPSPGGRACDREARHLLGFPRSGAIASAPIRKSLQAKTFKQAARMNRGMSPVTWTLLPRIAEVAREMAPYWQRTIFEVHPELSFYQLNDDRPLVHSKHTEEGQKERRQLLETKLQGIARTLDAVVSGAGKAHLLDAAACLWTSRRIMAKAVTRIPENPEWDDEGLRMEIVR